MYNGMTQDQSKQYHPIYTRRTRHDKPGSVFTNNKSQQETVFARHCVNTIKNPASVAA